jgi:hypothetical protein
MLCPNCNKKLVAVENTGKEIICQCRACNKTYNLYYGRLANKEVHAKYLDVTLDCKKYGQDTYVKVKLPIAAEKILSQNFNICLIYEGEEFVFGIDTGSLIYFFKNELSKISKLSLMFFILPITLVLWKAVDYFVKDPTINTVMWWMLMTVGTELIRILLTSFFIPHYYPVKSIYFADDVPVFEEGLT